MPDEYLIPASSSEVEYVEKRSRFICHLWPVGTEAEALGHLRDMREKYWDASHNVYAYSVKGTGAARYSDDGEPSGTSGMPVMDVFRKAGITDFCCVVTRYFGGVLLGAGGLVRAYSKSASLALEASGRARMTRLLNVKILCSYPQYERLRSEILRFGAFIEGTEFGADVDISLSIDPEGCDKLLPRVTELTAASALVEIVGESLRPVRIENRG